MSAIVLWLLCALGVGVPSFVFIWALAKSADKGDRLNGLVNKDEKEGW